MKMSDAQDVIAEREKVTGFRVYFEYRVGAKFQSDYFPDKDSEPPIETEREAQKLARAFAAKSVNRYSDVRVVRADNLHPVGNHVFNRR